MITRYQVEVDGVEAFLGKARDAVAALAARPGFVRADVGRAIDDADVFVITLHWRDVGSYRRALSSFEVKLAAVPLLSQAFSEASAFEVLHAVGPEGTVDAESAISPEASTYRLGQGTPIRDSPTSR